MSCYEMECQILGLVSRSKYYPGMDKVVVILRGTYTKASLFVGINKIDSYCVAKKKLRP